MAKRIQRGQFYSINNKQIKGHKGRVVSVKKGKVKAVVVTHSRFVKENKGKDKKTIQLNKNPDKKDKRKAFVSRKPKYAKLNQIGKHHPNMKVTDSKDKSVFRKIGKKK